MRRARRLRVVAASSALLVAASVGCAVPAAASSSEVAVSRAGTVTVTISVQDLAPPACAGIGLTTLVTREDIQGTKIQGTSGNDLILGSAGDDVLDGKQGDDCLVGGAGTDDLDGGRGADVCLPGSDAGDRTRRCEA